MQGCQIVKLFKRSAALLAYERDSRRKEKVGRERKRVAGAAEVGGTN